MDPNKQFYSPYKQPKEVRDCNYDERYLHGRKDSDSLCSSQVPQSQIEMCDFLRLSRNQISEFWSRHQERFVSFWRVMKPDARENFLRQVYPNIIQDLRDRYCWIDFKKQYRKDYENILVLSPYLNVVDLIYENHMINMMEKFSQPYVLVVEASELVLRLRDLHANSLYPWTVREADTYRRALRLRRGDSLYMSDPKTLEFGEVVIVDNPRTVLLPTGGDTFRLYKSGHLIHQIEFQKVTENIAFIMTLLNDIISMFSTEVMCRDATYLRNMTSLSLSMTSGAKRTRIEQDVFAVQSYSSVAEGRESENEDSSPSIQSLIRSHLVQLSVPSSTASEIDGS